MAGLLGMFIGGFTMSLLFAVIWLIIAKIGNRKPTERSVSIIYGIAAGVAFLPVILQAILLGPGGIIFINLLGYAACASVLYWQWIRDLAKLKNKSE